MRTVVISVISISSILLVIMIHNTINEESVRGEEIRDAVEVAMSQTMTEVMEQNSYGIENSNEWIAAFLQAMIQKLDGDISLTVMVHRLDREGGMMDVEAVGEYLLPNREKKTVSVRRQIAFVGPGR